MTAQLHDGWLVVPYDGPDAAAVRIGVSTWEGVDWKPAFLDYADGQRVAKVRAEIPEGRVLVLLEVGGVSSTIGRLRI